MIKKILSVIMASIVLLLQTAYATDNIIEGVSDTSYDVEKVTFIVELEGGGILEKEHSSGVSFFSAENDVVSVQSAAIQAISDIPGLSIQGTLSHIMNGLFVKGSIGLMDELQSLSGVKNVIVSAECFEIPEPVEIGETVDVIPGSVSVADDEDSTSSAENNSYSGKGTVVGIIDTELNTTHPAFSTMPPSPRLSKADIAAILEENDLVAESRRSTVTADNVYINEKIPFVFDYAHNDFTTKAYSTIYHGSHVSGIAAGNTDGFKGSAPDAQIIFMKVSPDSSKSISNANLLAALEDMVILDVDVINLSLGITLGFMHNTVYDDVLETIGNSGIVISAACGNDGRLVYNSELNAPLTEHIDYGTISFPSSSPFSTSVASIDSPVKVQSLIVDGISMEYFDSTSNFRSETLFDILGGGSYEYVYCGYGTENEMNGLELDGKIALIDRGSIDFLTKVTNAQTMGAVGVLIINSENEYLLTGGLTSDCIPTAMVLPAVGERMKNAETKTVTFNSDELFSSENTITTMSTFSSRGVAHDLSLKPEITAIGGKVYSAWYTGDKYGSLSGTSMASPMYCGTAATVLEYIKEKNPAISDQSASELVGQLILSTAKIQHTSSGDPISPRKQGAGYISTKSAITSPAVLYNNSTDKKTKLDLGEKSTNSFSFSFVVKNLTSAPVSYNLSGDIMTDSYTESPDGLYLIGENGRVLKSTEATLTFNSPSVTVGANSEKTVSGKITLSSKLRSELSGVFTNGFFIEGFFKLENTDFPTLSIPFTSFIGDWEKAPAIHSLMYDEDVLSHIKTPATLGYPQTGGFYGVKDNTYTPLNYDSETNTLYYSKTALDGLFYSPTPIRNVSKLTISLWKDSRNMGNMLTYTGYTKTKYEDIKHSDLQKRTSPAFGWKYTNGNYLDDGDYVVKFTTVLDSGVTTAQPDVPEMNIVLDSTSPKAVSASFDGDYLCVTFSEEHGGVLRLKNGNTVSDGTLVSSSGNIKTYKISLFGCSVDSCSIFLEDNAQNRSELKIYNDSFMGVYEDKKLTLGEKFRSVFADGSILNVPNREVSDKETKRVFVWDNMMPVMEAFSIE